MLPFFYLCPMRTEWKEIIENTWENRDLLEDCNTVSCINSIIEEIDKGRLRTAEPTEMDGE